MIWLTRVMWDLWVNRPHSMKSALLNYHSWHSPPPLFFVLFPALPSTCSSTPGISNDTLCSLPWSITLAIAFNSILLHWFSLFKRLPHAFLWGGNYTPISPVHYPRWLHLGWQDGGTVLLSTSPAITASQLSCRHGTSSFSTTIDTGTIFIFKEPHYLNPDCQSRTVWKLACLVVVLVAAEHGWQMKDHPLALHYGENRVVGRAYPSSPSTQCGNCWKLSHVKQKCKNPTVCSLCSGRLLKTQNCYSNPFCSTEENLKPFSTAASPLLPAATTIGKRRAGAIGTALPTQFSGRRHPPPCLLSMPWMSCWIP